MSNTLIHYSKIFLALFILLGAPIQSVFGQKTTTVIGKVFDAKTKEPLPFVDVILKGTYVGASTDLDGKYEYSEIVTAKISGNMQFEISPNPTTDQITIQVSKKPQNKPFSLEIFDIMGRQVIYREDFLNNKNSFQFSFQNANLSKGIYFLKIRNSRQEIAIEKLIFN